jgi:hypothetical protein
MIAENVRIYPQIPLVAVALKIGSGFSIDLIRVEASFCPGPNLFAYVDYHK